MPCTPTYEEVVQQHNQSHEKQQVNEAPGDMGQETYEPQYYQDDDN
jgi:hypothetical protein